jgi:hypothetical protein
LGCIFVQGRLVIALGKLTQNDTCRIFKKASRKELSQAAIQSIGLFLDVFKKHDRAIRRWPEPGTHQAGQAGQIAAEEETVRPR